jgi:hypothetical protein
LFSVGHQKTGKTTALREHLPAAVARHGEPFLLFNYVFPRLFQANVGRHAKDLHSRLNLWVCTLGFCRSAIQDQDPCATLMSLVERMDQEMKYLTIVTMDEVQFLLHTSDGGRLLKELLCPHNPYKRLRFVITGSGMVSIWNTIKNQPTNGRCLFEDARKIVVRASP